MADLGAVPIRLLPLEQTPSTVFATFALNETTDYIAVMFNAPSSQTVTQLGVNISAVSGSPNLEISLQGVSSGLPDGTIKSSGNAKASWAAATGWAWQTLTSSYASTAGEMLAWVVKLTSGTSATINVRVTGLQAHPFGVTYDNATTTTTKMATAPVWGAKGSGTTWCWGNPVLSAAATVIQTSTPNESGIVCTLPSWLTSAQLCGMRFLGSLSSTGTIECGVYSGGGASDTTRAQVVTITNNDIRSAGSTEFFYVYFPPITVNGGSSFRLALRATANSFTERNWTVSATEDALAWGGFFGNNGVKTTRRQTGNWTDTEKQLPFLEPIFSDFTVSSGGSGGIITHPGMAGGMRG